MTYFFDGRFFFFYFFWLLCFFLPNQNGVIGRVEPITLKPKKTDVTIKICLFLIVKLTKHFGPPIQKTTEL
jgi:hypothetical protein